MDTDARIVENMWTQLMDMKHGMNYEEQTEFLRSEFDGMTNREALAVLNELFTLRIAVDSLKDTFFPNGKETPYVTAHQD